MATPNTENKKRKAPAVDETRHLPERLFCVCKNQSLFLFSFFLLFRFSFLGSLIGSLHGFAAQLGEKSLLFRLGNRCVLVILDSGDIDSGNLSADFPAAPGSVPEAAFLP